MCEVMNYIFGSLSNSETVLLELDRVEQKKRIEKLESTIEEMKRDKGE